MDPASNPLHVLVPRPKPPLAVAVSDCLLGREVRFDGSHKRSSLCHAQLEGIFEFRGVCPEVAVGMGVPREPVRLVGPVEAPRALGVKTATLDPTDALAAYGRAQAAALDDIDGYLFMKGSPSCGLFRVKVYTDASPGAYAQHEGRGIYAAALLAARPELPAEESGRMNDEVLRENFITRAFAHAHWRAVANDGFSPKKLVAWHTLYKFLVLAHNPSSYKRLGQQVANLSENFDAIRARYFRTFMAALATPATRGGHANVLSHLQGYLKKDLAAPARRELADLIESYRRNEVPLLAVVTLLKHHLGTHEVSYALDQVYLNPHPPSGGYRRNL